MTCSFCGRNENTADIMRSAISEAIICERCTRDFAMTFDKFREMRVNEGIRQQGLEVVKREI
jgi:hypothetical protein